MRVHTKRKEKAESGGHAASALVGAARPAGKAKAVGAGGISAESNAAAGPSEQKRNLTGL